MGKGGIIYYDQILRVTYGKTEHLELLAQLQI